MYINEITVYGRLTKDVELKALPSGIAVGQFSVATTREWKSNTGEKQEETEFHTVVFFGKQAEAIAQWVKKGHTIYVRGRLKTRNWEKDGMKYYRTEIIGENFKFGDGNKKVEQQTQATVTASPAIPDYPEEEINPEDIPF